MRTTIITLLTILILHSNLNAQDASADQIPPVVMTSFKTKFPAAEKVKWEIKKESYKAQFKIESREHDLWLDKDGTVKKHKEDFPKSSLPETIRKKIETDFGGYKIDDVDKIEEGSVISYEVDLKGTQDKRKLLITSDGQVKENNPK